MEKLPLNVTVPKYAETSVKDIQISLKYLEAIGFSCYTCKGKHDYHYQLAHCRNCIIKRAMQFNWKPDEEAAKVTDFQRSLMLDKYLQEQLDKVEYVSDEEEQKGE